MDIQVGDKITYKGVYGVERQVIMINLDVIDDCKRLDIIKIERPHYEVIEEKKELLTKEEREYLKHVIDTINEYSGKNIKNIKFSQYTYHNEISFSDDLFIVGTITVRKEFYNLKSNQIYTLKELGLEEK